MLMFDLGIFFPVIAEAANYKQDLIDLLQAGLLG